MSSSGLSQTAANAGMQAAAAFNVPLVVVHAKEGSSSFLKKRTKKLLLVR
jgi:hypothetical protein